MAGKGTIDDPLFVRGDPSAPVPVDGAGGGGGGLTDDELRAAPVPVEVDGVATETTLSAILAALGGTVDVDDPDTQTALATLIGHVDGLEAALTTLNTHVDGLEGFTDGLEGLATTLSAKDFATQTTLAAIQTLLGGTGKLGAAPQISGGLTIAKFLDLDEADQQIKATAGQLYGWYLFNSAASTHYVKLWNATTANVTVGSTATALTIPVPAGAAANVEFTNGIEFATAITAACTTGKADNNSGAPAADAVTAMFFYK
jgi:hypothetical protein